MESRLAHRPFHKKMILSVTLLGCLALVGCGSRKSPEESGSEYAGMSDESAMRRFAGELEQQVALGEFTAIDEAIDRDTLFERVREKLGTENDPNVKKILDVMKEGILHPGFGPVVDRQLGKLGKYRFVKLQSLEDAPTALFRISHPDGGLDYHWLRLARQSNGGVKIIDVKPTTKGEWFSDSFFCDALVLFSENDEVLESMENQATDYRDHLQALLPFLAAYDQGDPPWVMEAFLQLPEVLRRKQLLARRHCQVVLQMPTHRAVVLPVLEAYLEQFPEDPSVWLWSIDTYIAAEKPDRAALAIEQLDAQLGGDPYLDFVRAELAFTNEDYAKMESLTRAGLAVFPESYFGNMLLLSALAVQEKHAPAVEVLEKLERRFGSEEVDAVLGNVSLGDLQQSEAFRKWEERRAP